MEEGEELKEKMRRLKEENAHAERRIPEKRAENDRLRQTIEEMESRFLCVVCYRLDWDQVLRPCRHLVCCSECAWKLGACPMCRADVEERVTVHILIGRPSSKTEVDTCTALEEPDCALVWPTQQAPGPLSQPETLPYDPDMM